MNQPAHLVDILVIGAIFVVLIQVARRIGAARKRPGAMQIPGQESLEESWLPAPFPVDPRAQGSLLDVAQAQARLLDVVASILARDPDKGVYPAMFGEFVGHSLGGAHSAAILFLKPDTHLSGDLLLDFDSGWARDGGIVGIACEGDLHVDGDVLNRNLNRGPLLFVAGNLHVRNLIKGGAPVIVLGNLIAEGIVVGEYNDGVARIAGDLTAQGLFLDDHDFGVFGTIRAPRLNTDEDDPSAVLAPELFEDEDGVFPGGRRLWSRQRAGLPLFLPDFVDQA